MRRQATGQSHGNCENISGDDPFLSMNIQRQRPLPWNNASPNRLPDKDFTTQVRRTSMPHFRKQPLALLIFPIVILLAGCNAKPECDSFETRDAVLHAVSDDHNNALGNYAAKNSKTASEATPEAEKSKQQPLYVLGEKIVTTSTSADKRTLKCSGSMSVTVGETKASKEVVFTVQQSPDGKIAVSVDPFLF